MIIIKIKSSVLALAIAATAGFSSGSSAGVFDSLISVANSALPAYGREQVLSFRPDLDNEQITSALREALWVASDRVVQRVVADSGYLGDREMRLSSDLRKAQKVARKRGHEDAFVQFEMQLTQSVVAAAPEMGDLFKAALNEVEITEPRLLLLAHDTAVTDYLRMRVTEKVQRQMQPIVQTLLMESGAKLSGNDISVKIDFGNLLETFMTDYVVEYSISSFFQQLEMEERAIRQDPIYRSSDLLRHVFG